MKLFSHSIFKEITTTHDKLLWKDEGGRALRIGDWKISALQNWTQELFNLFEDLTETRNLAAETPQKGTEREAIWEQYYQSIFPEANLK